MQLDIALRTLILGPCALAWIVFVVRLVGLRSFSKMAAFDFVVTIATGSLLAAAATADTWPIFLQALGAMLVLLVAQAIVAFLRVRYSLVTSLMENEPVLLMRNGVFHTDAMKRNRVTKDDVVAKLREANALDFSCVRAVVLEVTGDISVLHGETIDETVLEHVRVQTNSD